MKFVCKSWTRCLTWFYKIMHEELTSWKYILRSKTCKMKSLKIKCICKFRLHISRSKLRCMRVWSVVGESDSASIKLATKKILNIWHCEDGQHKSFEYCWDRWCLHSNRYWLHNDAERCATYSWSTVESDFWNFIGPCRLWESLRKWQVETH